MPFISKEQVKEIREEIKRAFPQFKFSIVNNNYDCVNISIIEGNIPFHNVRGYQQVNRFHIDTFYKDQPEWLEVLQKINNIASKNCKMVLEDSDYGSIPNYYIHINIGKWNIPYKYNS